MYGSISSKVHRSRVLNKTFNRSIKLMVKFCSIKVRTQGTFATDRSKIPIPRRKLSCKQQNNDDQSIWMKINIKSGKWVKSLLELEILRAMHFATCP